MYDQRFDRRDRFVTDRFMRDNQIRRVATSEFRAAEGSETIEFATGELLSREIGCET